MSIPEQAAGTPAGCLGTMAKSEMTLRPNILKRTLRKVFAVAARAASIG